MKRKVDFDTILSADRALKQWEAMWDGYVAEVNHCSVRKARKLRDEAGKEHIAQIKAEAREAEKEFPAAIKYVRDRFKKARDEEKASIVYHLKHRVIFS